MRQYEQAACSHDLLSAENKRKETLRENFVADLENER